MRRIRQFAFLLVIGYQSTALANLDEQMAGMFNDFFINVTPAGSYQTQRRGVITGGDISIRTTMTNPNLVSFTPPSINAGCNGIDIYGGSFSFINGAQFTQMLRNIAQASVGFAFHTAIEGMCPTCAQVMSKLQRDINDLNALMKNSCTAAKKLNDMIGISTGASSVHDWLENNTGQLNAAAGTVSDFLDSIDPSSGSTSTQKAFASGNSASVTGNVLWQALNDGNVSSWFVSNATNPSQMNQVVMSMTGAPIIGPNADNTDVQFYVRQPKVKLRDFIEGGDVTVYKCESDACLLPAETTEVIAVVGMRQRVKEMLYGTGTCAVCTGGIFRAYPAKTATNNPYSPAEQQFIDATSPGIASIMRIVGNEPGAAKIVSDQLADVLARTMAIQLVNEMYGAVIQSMHLKDQPMTGKLMEIMRDINNQIEDEKKVAAESTGGIHNVLNTMHVVKSALKSNLTNKVH